MLFCFSPKAEVDELRPVQQLKLKFQYFILFEMTHDFSSFNFIFKVTKI